MKIVVLSYNHPDLTRRCVQSARDHLEDSSILLVHNGSQKPNLTSLQKQFPLIEHLVLEPNKGFSGGANEGLRRAFQTSEWVLFLTNDCVLVKFSRQMKSAPGLTAPLIWARRHLARVDSLGGYLQKRGLRLFHCKDQEDWQRVQTLPSEFIPYIPGTAFWLHRDVFEQLNGFDEGYGTYWEDVDFSMRCWQQKIPLSTDSDTEIVHGIGKTCHKDPCYTTFLFQRNRKRLALLHQRFLQMPAWKIWVYILRDFFRLACKQFLRKDWRRLGLLWKALRS